jgi:O-antigen ligase
MHPGYLAMYANIAVLVLLNDFKKALSRRIIAIKSFTIILLLIFVVFLYSKTAIALLLFMLLAYGFRYAYKEKKIQYALLSVVLVFVFSSIVYFFVPNTQTRIKSITDTFSAANHNPASTESTQLRIHAWKSSRSVIEASPIVGHGTGDVWDVLLAEYVAKGYTGAQVKEVNAHNEYYQTGLATGLIGIAFLVFVLSYWLYFALKNRHFPLVIFVLITAFAFLFESYFSTQAGVVYASLLFYFVYALKNENHG